MVKMNIFKPCSLKTMMYDLAPTRVTYDLYWIALSLCLFSRTLHVTRGLLVYCLWCLYVYCLVRSEGTFTLHRPINVCLWCLFLYCFVGAKDPTYTYTAFEAYNSIAFAAYTCIVLSVYRGTYTYTAFEAYTSIAFAAYTCIVLSVQGGGGGTWGLYWYRCVYGYGILTVHRLVLLLVPVLEAVPGVLVVAGLQFVLFTRGHSVYRLRHRNFRGLNLSRYNKTVVDLFYSTYKTDKQFRYTLKHITTMAWLESLLPSDACFESFTFWNLPSTNAKWLPELAVHDVICLHLPPALPILYKFL